MRVSIANLILCCFFSGVALSSSASANESAKSKADFSIKEDILVIRNLSDRKDLPVSLKSPDFIINNKTVKGVSPLNIQGNVKSGKPVEVTYPPIQLENKSQLEVKLFLQWAKKESVLRKWASYRITGGTEPALVEEIILDKMPASIKGTQICRVPPQSYPVLAEGFFLGIEFPVATTRIDAGQIIVAHQPGVRMKSGEWYESRTAVYGLASLGKERDSFEKYIAGHYPHKKKFHINYNSWWTTGIPYNEPEILNLMKVFSDKLYKPYGIGFDTFTIDMGWSDKHTIWEVNKKMFPNGMGTLKTAAEEMGSDIGLWMSPAAAYPEALDVNWAKEQGYFTIDNGNFPLMCANDKRYVKQINERLTDMIEKYNVRQFKFDNGRLSCPSTGHDHEPGVLSAEPLAEAMISIFTAIRKAQPDVYFESNAFGAYQSPWWAFHLDALLSNLGADAPYGFIPCPSYMESYTTARDYYNLIGDVQNVCPISDLHVCGMVHQTPEPFMNDAVITIMRGSVFLPVYYNPRYMSDSRWKTLASILKWAKKNQDIILKTKIILPEATADGSAKSLPSHSPVPRQPYGYAHWNKDKGMIALRNPWIKPFDYSITLDEKIGIPRDAEGLSAVSIYPQVRFYADNLKYGSRITFPMAPYETIVLSIGKDQPTQDIANVRDVLKKRISLKNLDLKTGEVVFANDPGHRGPDWTNLLNGVQSALKVGFKAQVHVDAPKSDLLILLEDKTIPVDPICKVTVNGKEIPVTLSGSDTGWVADISRKDCKNEQWLFLKAPLSAGDNNIEVELLNRSRTPKVSAWVWAYKDGASTKSKYPNALPEPEIIYLDALNIFKPVSLESGIFDKSEMSYPVAKIDGIYLDALPAGVMTYDPAGLKLNQSIHGDPLMIAGRSYARGIGVLPGVKVNVALDGKYKRFQSWVGVDAGIELWNDSMLTFEVWVDGQKKWNSSVMERRTPAQFADVDVSGAKTLELVVVNSGGSKEVARSFNNPDWVEARLLK
ncbi:MAG: NPCBM/NEW2 domain-containing protein [Armatimonadota bacterium]